MKKVIKRVAKDIIASRSATDELKKGIEELKSKLAVEQEKWKTLDEELKKARDTVNSSHTQKESLARLAKVTRSNNVNQVFVAYIYKISTRRRTNN